MHLALAHQSYKAGDYNQALELCNTIYRKNPKRTDNLLLLGAIYYQVCFYDIEIFLVHSVNDAAVYLLICVHIPYYVLF